MTVSPSSKPGPHIQFLADISKTLSDPAAREQLLSAQSDDAVVDVFCREKAAATTA
jgi:PTS system nitrogen regulatory IIA component